MEAFAKTLAKKMLAPQFWVRRNECEIILDDTLEQEIAEVELLINKADGQLRSRQVVALIISSWRRRNPDKAEFIVRFYKSEDKVD